MFTNEDCSTIPSFQLSRDIVPLTDIDITPAMVLDKLMHLDPSKSSGPEGWPILSLKETAQQLFLYQVSQLSTAHMQFNLNANIVSLSSL